MRQKEVLQKLSKEIRDLHHIEIKKHRFHYYGRVGESGYIGLPTSLIEKIDENEITFHINFRDGVLTLWKNGPPSHLSIFDGKARDRRLARKRRKEQEVNKVGPMPRKLPEQSDTRMRDLPGAE